MECTTVSFPRAAIVGCLAAARGLGECLARKREFAAARDAHDLWLRQWLQSDQSADVRRRQTAFIMSPSRVSQRAFYCPTRVYFPNKGSAIRSAVNGRNCS